MKIDEIVAVSGLSGLFKSHTTRNNGMIIEDIDTGKSRFASIRKHQFTPLGTVAIYTQDDAAEIHDVFTTMMTQEAALPLPDIKTSKPDVLFAYFKEILPNYDRERVTVSDVKKVLKWYSFLRKRDLLPLEISRDSSKEEE